MFQGNYKKYNLYIKICLRKIFNFRFIVCSIYLFSSDRYVHTNKPTRNYAVRRPAICITAYSAGTLTGG